MEALHHRRYGMQTTRDWLEGVISDEHRALDHLARLCESLRDGPYRTPPRAALPAPLPPPRPTHSWLRGEPNPFAADALDHGSFRSILAARTSLSETAKHLRARGNILPASFSERHAHVPHHAGGTDSSATSAEDPMHNFLPEMLRCLDGSGLTPAETLKVAMDEERALEASLQAERQAAQRPYEPPSAASFTPPLTPPPVSPQLAYDEGEIAAEIAISPQLAYEEAEIAAAARLAVAMPAVITPPAASNAKGAGAVMAASKADGEDLYSSPLGMTALHVYLRHGQSGGGALQGSGPLGALASAPQPPVQASTPPVPAPSPAPPPAPPPAPVPPVATPVIPGARRVAFTHNWPPPHEGVRRASKGTPVLGVHAGAGAATGVGAADLMADSCGVCGAYIGPRAAADAWPNSLVGAMADAIPRCVRCELAARPSHPSPTLPWASGSRGPLVGLSRARVLTGHPMQHANGDASDRERRNAEVRWSVATAGGALDPEPLSATSLHSRGRGGERRLEGW